MRKIPEAFLGTALSRHRSRMVVAMQKRRRRRQDHFKSNNIKRRDNCLGSRANRPRGGQHHLDEEEADIEQHRKESS